MTLVFAHIFGAAIWFGAACTLPFWGKRLRRADNLDMVLGISDTVFAIKIVLIMGGLLATLVTGVMLTLRSGYPFFDFGDFAWLGYSQALMLLIGFDSILILAFMVLGRRGLRRFYRYVAPIGYNNIGFIALVYAQMTVKPLAEQQWSTLFLPLAVMAGLDALYVTVRLRKRLRLVSMPPARFAKHYFGLMNDENMYEFLGLFRDDARIVDPFATGVVRGSVEIERFFQFLGDQFEDIKMYPKHVSGTPDALTIVWRAEGRTKNGLVMDSLVGKNTMRRIRGKIASMDIDFDVNALPQVELYRPKKQVPARAASALPTVSRQMSHEQAGK